MAPAFTASTSLAIALELLLLCAPLAIAQDPIPEIDCLNCFEPRAESGCELPEVEACVCDVDPFCCDNFWERNCVNAIPDACNVTCMIHTPMPTFTPTAMPTPTPTAVPTPIPTAVPTPFPTPSPASPGVLDVQLSATGGSVRVSFDKDTDRSVGRQDDCESLFTTQTVALLGTDPFCRWESSSVLLISMGSGATLVWLGESTELSAIEFASEVEIFTGDTSISPRPRFEPGGAYFVAYPDEPAPPRASFSTPSIISACAESITFDARASSGLAGRQAVYRFDSTCVDILPESRAEVREPVLTIPLPAASETLLDFECEFSLTVESFLGLNSTVFTSGVVSQVDSDVVANVRIVGPGTLQWPRAEDLLVSADASVSICNGTEVDSSRVAFAFAWQVTSAAPSSVSIDLGGTTTSLPELRVPALLLEAGVSHEFTVEATVTNLEFLSPDSADTAPPVASSMLTLLVTPSPVVARISGAGRRVWSASAELTLDASASFDPDDPDADLTYEWDCVDADSDTPCLLLADGVDVTRPMLAVPANTLDADASYEFTVSVSSASTGRVGTTTTPTVVEMVSDAIPLVTISSNAVIGIDETARLEGSVAVGLPAEFAFVWREVSGALDLGALASESVQFLPLGNTQRNLVISPGLLNAGVGYIFELEATSLASGLAGRSQASMRVDFGPTIGSFTVTPLPEGEGALDIAGVDEDLGAIREFLYRMEVSAFSDFGVDAYPLSYRFALSVGGGSEDVDNAVHMSLGDFSFATQRDVILLPGMHIAEVSVQDRFGEVARLSAEVNVDEPSSSPLCTIPDMLSYLEMLMRFQDTSSALQVVHTLAVLLHMPDSDATMGVGCLDPSLRGRLIDVMEMLFIDGQLAEQHTQQVSDTLQTLTRSSAQAPPLSDIESVRVSMNISEWLLGFAEMHAEESDALRALKLANSIGGILANVLDSDVSQESAGFCDIITSAEAQLARYFTLQLGPLLAGESQDLLTAAERVAAGVSTADRDDDGLTLAGGSNDLSFQATLTVSESTNTVSLVVVTFDASLAECFELEGEIPEGPVVIIESAGGGDIAQIDFELRYEVLAGGQGGRLIFDDVDVCTEEPVYLLECGFRNETTRRWDTTGCETVDRIPVTDSQGVLQCRCDHLTVFGVIRSLRTNEGDPCATMLSPIAIYVLIVVYAVCLGVALLQLTQAHKIVRSTRDNDSIKLTRLSLTFIAMLIMAQIAWMIMYHWFSTQVAVVSFLVSSARVFMYWILSLMLYQWMSIVTMQLRQSMKDIRRTRRIASACVVLVTSVLVLTGVGFALVPSDGEDFAMLERSGTAIICAFNILTLVGFVIAGSLLMRKVAASMVSSSELSRVSSATDVSFTTNRGRSHSDETVSSMASTKCAADTATRKSRGVRKISKIQLRIMRITAAFCVIFAVQTTISLISAVSPDTFNDNFTTMMTLYLALDVAAIGVLFWISFSVIEGFRTKHKFKGAPFGSNKKARRGFLNTKSMKVPEGYTVSTENTAPSICEKSTESVLDTFPRSLSGRSIPRNNELASLASIQGSSFNKWRPSTTSHIRAPPSARRTAQQVPMSLARQNRPHAFSKAPIELDGMRRKSMSSSATPSLSTLRDSDELELSEFASLHSESADGNIFSHAEHSTSVSDGGGHLPHVTEA